MAVTKIATIRKWIGLSTDTKPTLTAGDDVSIGSTFLETDTKDMWVTYDGDNWTKRKRNSDKDRTADWRR